MALSRNLYVSAKLVPAHSHSLSSFAFLVSFLIMVTIYLTDDSRPAEGGVPLAYKQDFKIAGTEKAFRAC